VGALGELADRIRDPESSMSVAQLRHGPDGRWHPYAHEDGEWWPCAAADPDPVTALTTAWEALIRKGRRVAVNEQPGQREPLTVTWEIEPMEGAEGAALAWIGPQPPF
jgi:hypothetical protein